MAPGKQDPRPGALGRACGVSAWAPPPLLLLTEFVLQTTSPTKDKTTFFSRNKQKNTFPLFIPLTNFIINYEFI